MSRDFLDEEKPRRRREEGKNRGNDCESCGAGKGRRRSEHGIDAGVHCDECWRELLEEITHREP